jgi:hypothetical protein
MVALKQRIFVGHLERASLSIEKNESMCREKKTPILG